MLLAKLFCTLDTYTHVTGDMHRNAAEIVGGFLTEPLGEKLEPFSQLTQSDLQQF